MKRQRQIDALLAETASEWYERLKEGRPEDMKAFRAWCQASPTHIAAFLEITWTDRVCEALDSEHTIDVEALTREISTQGRTVSTLRTPESPSAEHLPFVGVRPHAAWRWALAALLLVFVVGGFTYRTLQRSPEEFATKIGELRTVELTDTSIVTLNTDSDIQVQFETHERNIELRHGEAVFDVAHDPSRPFLVHTQAGTVQAVGTKFNVYAQSAGTDVAVLEGRVRLIARASQDSPPAVEALKAGEQALIGLDGRIHRATHANIEGATAWSKRRLRFDETSLEEMVREFNRYQRNPRLRLEGIAAGTHHYSGIFDANDPEMLAAFLENEPDLAVERRADAIVIRAKVSQSPEP